MRSLSFTMAWTPLESITLSGGHSLLWCTGAEDHGRSMRSLRFPAETQQVLDALPEEIVSTDEDRTKMMAEGQQRLMFDRISVDIFLNTTPFHDDLRLHVHEHQLVDRKLPFLGCNDLAVFKAFFNRRKDWADIEEILRADRLDVPYVTGILSEYLGPDDERIRELLAIRDETVGLPDS